MIVDHFALPAGATCPECDGAEVYGLALEGRRYAACGSCTAVFWEPLPADAPPDVDGRPQPFRKSCDNCAFHRNSPERRDPEKWRGLIEAFAYQEQPFYCHKGVPIQIEGDGYPADHGFRYPLLPDGRADRARLRVCAGFIAWWKALCDEPVPGLTPGA